MNLTELYESSSLKQLTAHAHQLQERLASSYDRSRLGQSIDQLASSYDRSRLGRSIDQLVHLVRQSYLFQWLTTEPDPDVIVIDLRETYTVGPFLAVLDRLVPVAARSWRGSRLRGLTTASERHLRTQPIRLLSIILAVALAVNTLFSLVAETVTPVELGLRVVVLALAVVGTQLRHSWDELRETRVYALAVALLEPPDLPADDAERGSDVDEQ